MGFTGPTPKTRFVSLLKQFFSILVPILLMAASLSYLSLPLLGHWLVREDSIHPSDAIVVLAGRFPQRALEAAALYHRGYASEIWLTRPRKRGSFDEAGQFQASSEDNRNFEVLRRFGVPAHAIRVLDMPIVNTADELNAIDSGLKESGVTSLIIVTSKAHTRRVFSLWDKYHSGVGQVLVHGVSDDEFSPSRWWRNASSRGQAIHELLGMLDVWAGMPVRRPLPSAAPVPWDAAAAPAPTPPGD